MEDVQDGVILNGVSIQSENIENKMGLTRYYQVLDYVEIDSTFYRTPSDFHG